LWLHFLGKKLDFRNAYERITAKKSQQIHQKAEQEKLAVTVGHELMKQISSYANSIGIDSHVSQHGPTISVGLKQRGHSMQIRINGPDAFNIKTSVGNPADQGTDFNESDMEEYVVNWLIESNKQPT
jgi:hypothetical protein